jgi:hypothetical protein
MPSKPSECVRGPSHSPGPRFGGIPGFNLPESDSAELLAASLANTQPTANLTSAGIIDFGVDLQAPSNTPVPSTLLVDFETAAAKAASSCSDARRADPRLGDRDCRLVGAFS